MYFKDVVSIYMGISNSFFCGYFFSLSSICGRPVFSFLNYFPNWASLQILIVLPCMSQLKRHKNRKLPQCYFLFTKGILPFGFWLFFFFFGFWLFSIILQCLQILSPLPTLPPTHMILSHLWEGYFDRMTSSALWNWISTSPVWIFF